MHNKSVQLIGYLRITIFAVLIGLFLCASLKTFAIAPHAPEISLQAKIDYERKCAERQRQQRAYDKEQRHRENARAPKPSKREQKEAAKHKTRTMA